MSFSHFSVQSSRKPEGRRRSFHLPPLPFKFLMICFDHHRDFAVNIVWIPLMTGFFKWWTFNELIKLLQFGAQMVVQSREGKVLPITHYSRVNTPGAWLGPMFAWMCACVSVCVHVSLNVRDQTWVIFGGGGLSIDFCHLEHSAHPKKLRKVSGPCIMH